MARILGGGMFGQMSGKLGSLVFARNRGGNYARAYVKPVDPMTIAQLNARSNFGIASGNYHALDPILKAQWSNFATNTFNPMHGTMGVPSGFNAFTALTNTVTNLNFSGTSTYLGPTPLIGTNNIFATVFTPPSFALQANFVDGSTNVHPYSLQLINDITVASDSVSMSLSVDFDLNIDGGGIGPGAGDLETFSDAVGNGFGFSVYMSNSVAQEGMFIQNPEMIKLGNIEGLAIITTPAVIPSILTIQKTFVLPLGSFDKLPSLGDKVQLTIYAVSTEGQQIRIGSRFCKFVSI